MTQHTSCTDNEQQWTLQWLEIRLTWANTNLGKYIFQVRLPEILNFDQDDKNLDLHII